MEYCLGVSDHGAKKVSGHRVPQVVVSLDGEAYISTWAGPIAARCGALWSLTPDL